MTTDNSQKKVLMPHQLPGIRSKNWEEVATGYTAEMAFKEAERCIGCKNSPCISGCPVDVDIPRFIKKIKEGLVNEAYSIITKTNALPAICGRVCPQETQCEAKCIRGLKGEPVAIGRLERFAADNAKEDNESDITAIKNGCQIAIIGSGPAGLTCAGALAKLGYDVTIFEAFHKPGGVLVYGIPEFRLPKSIVSKEISILENSGVLIKVDHVIGRIKTISELFEEGYKAIFVSTGAGLPMFMGITGEEAIGVYSANEFLTRINLMKAYDKNYVTPINVGENVAVVGGGNVAMDAARCAKRMGAEIVTVIYRRSEQEMPARREEIEHAKEEGIILQTLSNPVSIISNKDGYAEGLEYIKMKLGEPDSSGRRAPIPEEGTNQIMRVDTVIMAIGTSPNPLIAMTTENLEIKPGGCVKTDDNMRTSIEGVWAGGDVVTGSATVILAMGAGLKAAYDIDKYINISRNQ